MHTSSDGPRPSELQRLGRYKIVRPLSKGGMALVYEARRESLAGVSPRVAIKLILPQHESSETFRELFINEARLGASMHHQNLVQIQDFDCDGDRYFLVMEYVEGLTLRGIISLCQRFGLTIPVGVVAELGRQACDGLHYAHCAHDEQGRHLRLVHRDIKPSNLILSPHGVVKVLDFGISKGRLRRERQGSVKGTWGYMAPEQAAGEEVQPTADVFGLATVLYELAALRPMFQDKSRDEIKRLLRDDHAARMAATLDAPWSPLIPVLVRALQRDPKARYGTAEELGRALSALLPDPITARDEVTRFYERARTAEAGRGPAGPSVSPRAPSGSLSPSQGARPTRAGGGRSVGAVAAAGVAGLLLLAAAGGAALVLDRLPQRAPADEEVADVAPQHLVPDEPAGPAGEGAPGEARPAPGHRPPPRAAPSVGSAPDPKREVPAHEPDVARVVVVRPADDPEPAASVATSGAGDPAEEPPADAETGLLLVGAKQAAEVYIGGQYVADAPVRQELPPGRYTVNLVAQDGRRRTFVVEIEAGRRIRKTWDFDRMEWR